VIDQATRGQEEGHSQGGCGKSWKQAQSWKTLLFTEVPRNPRNIAGPNA